MLIETINEKKQHIKRQLKDSQINERQAPDEPWARIGPDNMNRKVHITLVGDYKTSSEALKKLQKTFANVEQEKGSQSSEMYLTISDVENPKWKADAVKKILSGLGYNIQSG